MANKMFVYFSGTKSAFAAAGHESTYSNNIVFISGDANGAGAAIYAHGKYFANLDEALASLKYFSKVSVDGTTAEASANGSTLNFTADDPASVSVKVDAAGVHFALTDAFKTAVNTTLPNRIKAIEDDYVTESELTTAVTNGTSELSSKVSALENSQNTQDGKISTLESQVAALEAGTYDDSEVRELISANTSAISANTEAIAVLNGTGEGSVDKKIDAAFNDFATKVSDDSVVNTYKELIDYAAEHGAEFTTLVGKVDTNTSSISQHADEILTLKSNVSTAQSTADDAASAASAAQSTADSALAKANAAYVKPSDGIPASDLATSVQTSLDKADAAAPQATTYTKTEVDDMWAWLEL